jgi:hypothetical protein
MTTTSDGRFEIAGLLPGDYRLRGLAPDQRLAPIPGDLGLQT